MILGVDPGLNGALAFFDVRAGVVTVHDMPTIASGVKSKRVVDEAALARLFNGTEAISHAFVEKVGAMPGNGSVSMFGFGVSYGLVRGVLAANFVPITLVPPQTWKSKLGVPASKEGARARASQLLPAFSHLWPLVKHDGRAEAALIAYYGVVHASR